MPTADKNDGWLDGMTGYEPAIPDSEVYMKAYKQGKREYLQECEENLDYKTFQDIKNDERLKNWRRKWTIKSQEK